MPLNIEIEVQDCEQADINVTNQCETLTLEIIDAPTGSGGADGYYIRTAGTSISALQAVYERPDGTVWPLSADDSEHIDLLVGIAITGAREGAGVAVQRSGLLDASGLNLQPGRVWLGTNGQLTQTPPDSGNDTLLGYATAEQRLYIDISETILLED